MLDRAFYTCNASNIAGYRTTEGRLEVIPEKIRRPDEHDVERRPVSPSMPPSTLPERAPAHVDHNWMLDTTARRPIAGTCKQYRGEACDGILTGRAVLIEYDNAEQIRDIG